MAIESWFADNPGNFTRHYLFTDALGSVDTVANASGGIVERMSFDAHGNRRSSTDWQSPLGSIPSSTRQGFTGHHMLDVFGLIHMNGRVYDPQIGRFLQADVLLDAGIQGLNRYSYVLNNPLSLTDPSGHMSVGQILRTVAAIAITVYTGGAAAGLLAENLVGQALAVAMAGGFAAGAIQSGTLKGALTGAYTSMAFFAVGSYFKAAEWASKGGKLTTIGRTAKIVAHGVVGGVSSELQGASFGSGFASAGFSELAGPLTENLDSNLAQVAASALVGGTASRLSGGKFANGAVTGAMSWAFNELVHRDSRASSGRENTNETVESELQPLQDRAYEITGREAGTDGMVEITYSELLEVIVFEKARIKMNSNLRGGFENLNSEEFGWELYNRGDSMFFGSSYSVGGVNFRGNGGAMYKILGAPFGFGGPYLGGNLNYINQGLMFAAAGRPLQEALTAVHLWNTFGHSSNQYISQRMHLTTFGYEQWGK